MHEKDEWFNIRNQLCFLESYARYEKFAKCRRELKKGVSRSGMSSSRLKTPVFEHASTNRALNVPQDSLGSLEGLTVDHDEYHLNSNQRNR
jgi:hypothetical protein